MRIHIFLWSYIWTSDADINIEYGYEKGSGSILAWIIAGMPQKLIKQVRDREAGGLYKMVLREYLKQMEITIPDPVEDYNRIKGIWEIMKLEKYLLFSDDIEVKELYCKICKLAGEKYGKYMSYVR